MSVQIGNFFFCWRNGLFPFVYLLLFVPSRPLLEDPRTAALAGFIIACSGQLLRALTVGLDYIIRGGRNRQVYAQRLVQAGLFAHCRNPLYVGNFLILVGLGVASNSMLFLLSAIPFFAFAYWTIILAEEHYLRGKFGAEFDEYCERVNRLVPRLSGLGHTLSDMQFNWPRLINAEYGSAYIWVAAILLVTLKNIWVGHGRFPSGALAVWLWALLGAATVAYGVARLLKKTRILRA